MNSEETQKEVKFEQAIERKYDKQFKLVFKILSEMVMTDAKPKKSVGYLTESQPNTRKGKKVQKKVLVRWAKGVITVCQR